jgi:hypothetical protein
MNVLISDDEPAYGEALVNMIHTECEHVKAVHFQNWEDALAEITDAKVFYDLVIIDGKGQLNSESSANDEKHAIRAHTDLLKLKAENKVLDYVINTGFHKEFQSYGAVEVEVFRKPEDQDNLIEFITKMDRVNDLMKMKQPYESSFEGAQFLKGAEGQIRLFEILKANDSGEFNYQKIREFVENLIHKLISEGTIPSDIISKGTVNIAGSIAYLSGSKVWAGKDKTLYEEDKSRRIIDQSIEQCLFFIWRCTSAVEHNASLGSSILYQSLTCALLVVLKSVNEDFNTRII